MEKRDTTKHNAPKDGTSQRVSLAVGGTAHHSCTAKANGKGESKGKGTKGFGKGKKQGPQFWAVRSAACAEAAWQDTWDYQENEWQHIGMLGKVAKLKPTKDCVSGPRYNFNALSSDNEEPQKQVDPCCNKDHSIACEDRRVTVDIRDLIKHSTKKSGKCPKTLREDGSRNLRGCNMESQTRRKGVVTLDDVDELDAIIEESRKIWALTKITECISPYTETKLGWKRVSVAVDSGACEDVIKQAKASMSEVKYASATGEEILNLGEVVLPVITAEGTKRRMRLQAAEVSRPLASVKRICEAGHIVVFDDTGSFILNKASGETNALRDECGSCMLDLWVPPRSELGFAQP